MTGQADIRMKGVPIEEDRRGLPGSGARSPVQGNAHRQPQGRHRGAAVETARLAVRRVANDWTGKKPIVDVTIVQALTAGGTR